MSRRRIIALVITVLWVSAISFAAAANYAVGTCKPNMKSYPTISLAVSDPATANSTILVCPGAYQEQVVISQPLTLQGISIGGSSAAVISVPQGYLQSVAGGAYSQNVTYQILVQNVGGGLVNLTNLIVDGTNGAPQNNGLFSGIYYQDASGIMTNVVTRNQSYQGLGVGILAESSVVTSAAQTLEIQKSIVSNFSETGIWAVNYGPGLDVTLVSNFISSSYNSNGVPSAGIEIVGSPTPVTGTIGANVIAGTALYGLELANASVTAANNTIQGAVYFGSSSSTLKGNHIDARGSVAMQFDGPSANVVESNTILNASTAVFGCYAGPGEAPSSGNTLTKNTFVGADVGIRLQSSSNTFIPNTFKLVSTAIEPCF